MALKVCSPLKEIVLSQIEKHIVNPYKPPHPGSDDPHQGVDIAILDKTNGYAIPGAPVQAILDGKVVLVIDDRFPYGNAILIETPLNQLPPGWFSYLQIPTPAPTLPPHPSLTCPVSGFFPNWDDNKRSLYLLYAHMLEPSRFKPGDPITCGDTLGAIGESGNALNPHLHIEARVGPAGVVFPGLAHYETRARPEEMEAYCLWRVSGVFQLLDPMSIFAIDQ
jgi:murein DD-endopeptidase MepM/ murein hydrolase activator NlpD